MKDEPEVFASFILCLIVMCVPGLILGMLINTNSGAPEATKSATIFCVEKPKECKIGYDYYKLEDKTK